MSLFISKIIRVMFYNIYHGIKNWYQGQMLFFLTTKIITCTCFLKLHDDFWKPF